MYGLIIDTPRSRCNQYKNLFLFCLFACFIVSLSFFFLYCFYFHFIFYFLFVGGILFCHETILDHLLLPMDTDGRLRTNLFDKEDHFNFPIVNFPFICIGISSYGVYISELIRSLKYCAIYKL
jgi:hypothetical protein